MIVKDYIDNFALENEHPYDSRVILKWINLVEQNLDVLNDYRLEMIPQTQGESEYSLPLGVSFEDVYGLRINGQRYKKVDVREYDKPYTFWQGDRVFCINPASRMTDDISKPTMRLVYKYKPPVKVIDDIEIDTLYLPDRWSEIYDYFLLSKIAYSQKEYQEAQNHMIMFNNKVAEYEAWYEDNRPMKPEEEIRSRDDFYYDRG